jgi:hypothetical protein
MRIYVAGRFSQYERCRAVMDALTAAGHMITMDWTRTDEFGADGHPKHTEHGTAAPTTIPAERLVGHALNDIEGCRSTDLVVVLADEVLTGALIEIGAALASGVRVWVCAPYRWTIFWEHPLVEVLPNEHEALARLGATHRAAA